VFTRIVVAYNDSPAARRALALAVDLAQATPGARLTALAVAPRLPRGAATVGEVADAHESGQRACTRWLKAAAAYASERGVDMQTEIRVGRIGPAMADVALAHRADVFVLGRSHRPLRARILRTALGEGARCTCCPILLAP
jgi:nucleotide-binding universal stress UspA family protein